MLQTQRRGFFRPSSSFNQHALVFSPKGQKLSLRILERMIWEFTLVSLQTRTEFHQASQLTKKVDTMAVVRAWFASLSVCPCCCVPVCLSGAQQAGTPLSTALVSLAEMKRLLALSHERKFPSKCIERVCRGVSRAGGASQSSCHHQLGRSL